MTQGVIIALNIEEFEEMLIESNVKAIERYKESVKICPYNHLPEQVTATQVEEMFRIAKSPISYGSVIRWARTGLLKRDTSGNKSTYQKLEVIELINKRVS